MPQVKPHVILLCHTPAPTELVAAAAKLCYASSGIDELTERITQDDAKRFAGMLEEIGHESPVEHASFTFGIEGVSRSFLAQLTRHRIASYSVQSQRYVSLSDFGYIIPPDINADEEAREVFIRSMEKAREDYNILSGILCEKYTNNSIYDKKTARKKAQEDARFVLPNACETKLIVTMNARSLRNFFRLRLCNRAQWEIRSVAELMREELMRVTPELFKKCAPACVFGDCPEGKMSCGCILEVRQRYGEIKA